MIICSNYARVIRRHALDARYSIARQVGVCGARFLAPRACALASGRDAHGRLTVFARVDEATMPSL